MHGAGFEPAKHNAMALETIPVDHLGIRAVVLCHYGQGDYPPNPPLYEED